jgi:hypothetical protein
MHESAGDCAPAGPCRRHQWLASMSGGNLGVPHKGQPDLHIAEEVSDGRFRIAGGTPWINVSWQVTGIRKDPWAERNRIVVALPVNGWLTTRISKQHYGIGSAVQNRVGPRRLAPPVSLGCNTMWLGS